MPSAGFEPLIPAIERLQMYTLDSTATGINYFMNCDSLRAGRSGDRILVGARFSASAQAGPGAHPASYTMGITSFPGVKRPEHGVDHPPPSSAEVKEKVEHTSTPLLRLRGLLYVERYFTLT
jgi:hypothetical protein